MAVKDYYKVSGDSVERLNQSCPKCGDGVFLANHKNRLTCGKCGIRSLRNNVVFVASLPRKL